MRVAAGPLTIKTLKCVQFLKASGKYLRSLRMQIPKERKQNVDISGKLKYIYFGTSKWVYPRY
jgi:hypothetical protein